MLPGGWVPLPERAAVGSGGRRLLPFAVLQLLSAHLCAGTALLRPWTCPSGFGSRCFPLGWPYFSFGTPCFWFGIPCFRFGTPCFWFGMPCFWFGMPCFWFGTPCFWFECPISIQKLPHPNSAHPDAPSWEAGMDRELPTRNGGAPLLPGKRKRRRQSRSRPPAVPFPNQAVR